jgi:hypothetical protein
MNYTETMQLKGSLQDELRSRSRIHDVVNKEFAARFFGLPLDTYYHTPLSEWIHQSRRLDEILDCMSRDVKAVSDWAGIDLYTHPFSSWYLLYRDWLKQL